MVITTVPVAVPVPPVASGKNTVIVAPARTLPVVVTLQVAVSAAVMALQFEAWTPAVVGMKIRGIPPTAAPVRLVAVREKLIAPVTVPVPDTLGPLAGPWIVTVAPTAVSAATPGVPLSPGVATLVGSAVVVGPGVFVGVGVQTTVPGGSDGLGAVIAVAAAVTPGVGTLIVGVVVRVMVGVNVTGDGVVLAVGVSVNGVVVGVEVMVGVLVGAAVTAPGTGVTHGRLKVRNGGLVPVPGPVTTPLTVNAGGPTAAPIGGTVARVVKVTMTVEPWIALPAVVPLQVTVPEPAATTLQVMNSVPTVVVNCARTGVPPGTMAVSVQVMLPVTVPWPFTWPETVQTWPTSSAQPLIAVEVGTGSGIGGATGCDEGTVPGGQGCPGAKALKIDEVIPDTRPWRPVRPGIGLWTPGPTGTQAGGGTNGGNWPGGGI